MSGLFSCRWSTWDLLAFTSGPLTTQVDKIIHLVYCYCRRLILLKCKVSNHFRSTCRLSQLVYMIATTFQRLHPCFPGQATRRDYLGYCLTSGYVGNRRWRPLTGSRLKITYPSARIHDSNVIPTAIPMFSALGHTSRLLWKLPDVWSNEELKMASVNRKLICAIFDSSQIMHTSSSLHSSLVLLPAFQNIGI